VNATSRGALDERSLHLRRLAVRGIGGARRGHVGSAFSVVEVLRVLYDDVLRHDPQRPDWGARDRCILSKGHGCLALYAVLADKGYFPAAELDRFCAPDGILGGHPEKSKVPGVEASTGSLGHGLSIGIGQAIAARYAPEPYRVFVVVGDGESNEGSVWEAALSAAKHRLENLTVIVDYNKHQSYASTREVLDLEPLSAKWAAFGFGATDIDGHDTRQLRRTLGSLPVAGGRPSAVICHTVKGKGITVAENNLEWHHKNRVSDEEMAMLHRELGGQ
jgi:transketolase